MVKKRYGQLNKISTITANIIKYIQYKANNPGVIEQALICMLK